MRVACKYSEDAEVEAGAAPVRCLLKPVIDEPYLKAVASPLFPDES